MTPFYFADVGNIYNDAGKIVGHFNEVWKKTGSQEELILRFVKTRTLAEKLAHTMNLSHWSVK